MMSNLQIFVLSFGRKKVPTLKLIADPSKVIVLTSEDNEFKDQIESNGARVIVFDKNQFKGRGLEMMNEESVPHRRSAVYGYNYAIDWGRKNGVRYICVLDDDYTGAQTINNRTENTRAGHKPMLDKWAAHAVAFLQATGAAATCAINGGQLRNYLRRAYQMNIEKRQLMNTIVFDVTKEHNFVSLGNGDYCTQALTNSASLDYIVRLQTLCIGMESIKDKKHATINYSNLYYSRFALIMVAPAYSDVRILKRGGKDEQGKRFNSIWLDNSAPKFVSL